MRTLTFVLFINLASFASAQEFLTRSIYVPLYLNTCEHIVHPILYESNARGDQIQPLALLPGKRIFQFTYYPSLQRMEPSQTIIKMTGMYSGEEIFQYITVTPERIHLSHSKRIELSKANRLQANLRYKRDIRYKPVTVNLQCEICGHSHKKEETKVAAANQH